MNSDEMRNWLSKQREPIRGTLPNLGNGIDYTPFKGLRDGLRSAQDNVLLNAYMGNFDPAINGILSHVPSLRHPIQDGRLKFHFTPGFIGFKYNF